MPNSVCAANHRVLWEASGKSSTVRRTTNEAQEFLSRIVTRLLPARVVAGHRDPDLLLLVAENREATRSYAVQLLAVEPAYLAAVLQKSLAEVVASALAAGAWAIHAVYRELDQAEQERLVVVQLMQGTIECSATPTYRRRGPHAS